MSSPSPSPARGLQGCRCRGGFASLMTVVCILALSTTAFPRCGKLHSRGYCRSSASSPNSGNSLKKSTAAIDANGLRSLNICTPFAIAKAPLVNMSVRPRVQDARKASPRNSYTKAAPFFVVLPAISKPPHAKNKDRAYKTARNFSALDLDGGAGCSAGTRANCCSVTRLKRCMYSWDLCCSTTAV